MVRNFLFHQVNPKRNALWDPMDVALFERCIKHIHNKYDIVLIEESGSELDSFNSKYATIMFDDGYKDNLIYAAPILARYKCKASFYVATDCIDRNVLTWTHFLEYAFEHTTIDGITLDFDFMPATTRVTNLPDQQARINYIRNLMPFLRSITHEQRTLILDRVKETYTDIEPPSLMMDWEDLRELKNAGHYIGSHTVTHCMLGTMADTTAIRQELTQSASRIETELGHTPISIAYPVGSYNGQTKEIAKDIGYQLGLAVAQDVYDPAKDDRFAIPRIELYNEPWWKTKLRITNRLEHIKRAIGYRKD